MRKFEPNIYFVSASVICRWYTVESSCKRSASVDIGGKRNFFRKYATSVHLGTRVVRLYALKLFSALRAGCSCITTVYMVT